MTAHVRFTVKLAAKLAGIAFFSAVTAVLIFYNTWLFAFITATLSLWLSSSVFRSVKDSERASDMLISAMKNDDGTFSPSKQHINPHIVHNIIQIKNLLSEKQDKISGQEQFFKEIIELVNTGIICLLPDGKVKVHNSRALSLLHRTVFTHIKQLSTSNTPLYGIMSEISGDETRQLATATESLLIHAVQTEIHGERIKIITIDDIDTALADHDIESWSRYSSVIIHELKNSLTPIASISGQLLSHPETDATRMLAKIGPIHSCATYLKNFVDGLSKMNTMPAPSFSLFNLHGFLKRSAILASHINAFPIENIVIDCDESLLANSDECLLGQVITNILKNSIEAVAETPQPAINISGYCNGDESIIIDITNNGTAITQDAALKIFVPFFTTKKNGSGIGLPLARQLTRRCNGTLKLVDTSPHPVFRITLP